MNNLGYFVHEYVKKYKSRGQTALLREIFGFFLALRVFDLDSKRVGMRYKSKVRFELRLSE